MDVFAMRSEILTIPYSMVGKSSLPDFAVSELKAEPVGVSTLDELNGPFQSHAHARCQYKVHMLGHQDKRVQLVFLLSSISIHSLKEKPDIRFHDEKPSPLPRNESDKICSVKGKDTRRLHSRPQWLPSA
jgi:hypothetical protein